jgi:RNA polymerase sigma factor (sigma-70 family)
LYGSYRHAMQDCYRGSSAVVESVERVSDDVESLARRYHGDLLRVLRVRLRSEQDAADLAQEAYVRVLRYEGTLSAEEQRRMLFRIASNLLTDHWRWNQRWRLIVGNDLHVAFDELDVESGQPSHERQLAGEQRLARLEEIVAGMPDKRRTVFILSRIHGLRNSEIAAQCGISVKTVEKHLALALAECRAEVGDDGL